MTKFRRVRKPIKEPKVSPSLTTRGRTLTLKSNGRTLQSSDLQSGKRYWVDIGTGEVSPDKPLTNRSTTIKEFVNNQNFAKPPVKRRFFAFALAGSICA